MDTTLEEPLITDIRSPLEDLWPNFDLTENFSALTHPAPRSRPIVHIDADGNSMMIEFHKHRIVRDLNVRYRDAMMLDPSIPTPFQAAILIRDKALIVNIEAVRLIICANQCYLLSVPKVNYISSSLVFCGRTPPFEFFIEIFVFAFTGKQYTLQFSCQDVQ